MTLRHRMEHEPRVPSARVGGRIVFRMWALDGVLCLLFP